MMTSSRSTNGMANISPRARSSSVKLSVVSHPDVQVARGDHWLDVPEGRPLAILVIGAERDRGEGGVVIVGHEALGLGVVVRDNRLHTGPVTKPMGSRHHGVTERRVIDGPRRAAEEGDNIDLLVAKRVLDRLAGPDGLCLRVVEAAPDEFVEDSAPPHDAQTDEHDGCGDHAPARSSHQQAPHSEHLHSLSSRTGRSRPRCNLYTSVQSLVNQTIP
jgi:hypothetical protein